MVGVINENKLNTIISNSIRKVLNEGYYEWSDNDKDTYTKSELTRDIYNFLRQYTDDVRIDNSQVSLIVGFNSKFAVDKVAAKYRGNVKIVQGKNTKNWFIYAL